MSKFSKVINGKARIPVRLAPKIMSISNASHYLPQTLIVIIYSLFNRYKHGVMTLKPLEKCGHFEANVFWQVNLQSIFFCVQIVDVLWKKKLIQPSFSYLFHLEVRFWWCFWYFLLSIDLLLILYGRDNLWVPPAEENCLFDKTLSFLSERLVFVRKISEIVF